MISLKLNDAIDGNTHVRVCGMALRWMLGRATVRLMFGTMDGKKFAKEPGSVIILKVQDADFVSFLEAIRADGLDDALVSLLADRGYVGTLVQ